jgi:hypothetical protein
VWNQIVENVSKALPDFNDYLLRRFRDDKVKGMLEYLDIHFRSMSLFKGALVYQGFHVLSPEERVAYLLSDRHFSKGVVQIQPNTSNMVRFDFVYEGSIMSFFTEMPYMMNHAITTDGTENYPLLAIMEKVLHRVGSKVFIKVALAPLVFIRSHQAVVRTTSGVVYKDFVPTTKIHWGRGGMTKRSANKTPILLYHLCEYGLLATLKLYKFIPGETLQLVEQDLHREGFVYFKVKDTIFIEVKESEMTDKFKRRVILSLMYIFAGYSKFTLDMLYYDTHGYFKLALGHYTYAVDKQALLYKNAEEHLLAVRNMMDPAASYAISMIGLTCTNVFELLEQAFYKIDEWLIYRPTNLYDKRLGSLDHMLAGLIRHITSEQFKIMRNRAGVNHTTIARFMRRAPTRWIGGSIFRPNPEACNDNWLLTIGAKRFRSLEAMETQGRNARSNKASVAMSADIKRAHPSNLVIESVLAIPSSSPIISGTINPYAEIDTDGNFKRPDDLAKLVEHVFD